jgi:hypothetical protein
MALARVLLNCRAFRVSFAAALVAFWALDLARLVFSLRRFAERRDNLQATLCMNIIVH